MSKHDASPDTSELTPSTRLPTLHESPMNESPKTDGQNRNEEDSVMQMILHRSIQDQIRDRAYELYVQRGRKDGNQLQDWLDAEFELLANR